jgi:hypothetical protein
MYFGSLSFGGSSPVGRLWDESELLKQPPCEAVSSLRWDDGRTSQCRDRDLDLLRGVLDHDRLCIFAIFRQNVANVFYIGIQ